MKASNQQGAEWRDNINSWYKNSAGYLGKWTTALSYEIPPKFALINFRFLPKASQNVFSTKTTLFIFLLSRTMFLAISMPIQFCSGENAGPNDENAKPNSEHPRSPVLTFLTTSFILGDGPLFHKKNNKDSAVFKQRQRQKNYQRKSILVWGWLTILSLNIDGLRLAWPAMSTKRTPMLWPIPKPSTARSAMFLLFVILLSDRCSKTELILRPLLYDIVRIGQ